MSAINHQNQLTIQNNLRIVSQFTLNDPFSLQIVKEKNELLIKRSHFFKEIFQRIFCDRREHLKKLKEVIKDNISILEAAETSWFLRGDRTYTDLFLAVQKYNQTVAGTGPIIRHRTLRELAPVKISQVARSHLQNIPDDQKPHVHQEGWFWKHNVYHYNEEDTSVHHGLEAIRIFLSTQFERILSALGIREYHYFRGNEDIYCSDAPLASVDVPTSYWIGHATCLMNLPLITSSGRKMGIQLITDPVEGDLHPLLYPRMTKPARQIEECPAVHVFLLSHNHLDHYDASTIQKLLAQQPVMIVPEGDGDKLKRMGFEKVYENNWWQSTTITFEQAGETAQLKITAVPSRHWSGQGICDSHRSAFVGYVIHRPDGDIYFAGDTARLSNAHIQTLKESFNIRAMFQPGGPDEVRRDMQSTHQASVDGLWMHMKLMVKRFYEREGSALSKQQFIEQAKQLKTLFMHTKTFKLGNLHFDDTDLSVGRVLNALRGRPQHSMKEFEREVYQELCQLGQQMVFSGEALTPSDIDRLLKDSVEIPKIGQRSLLRINP
jgi:L-ascorbate metabolism protein UlaG (beta-lactamase superfamily)